MKKIEIKVKAVSDVDKFRGILSPEGVCGVASAGYDVRTLSNSQLGLCEIASHVVEIDHQYCLSQAFDQFLLIDVGTPSSEAHVYRFPFKHYSYAKIEGRHLYLKDRKTKKWLLVYDGVLPHIKGLYCNSGYSEKGTTGGKYTYKSICFSTPNASFTNVNVKLHQIIQAIMLDYEVIDATGVNRSSDIHHVKKVVNGGSNSCFNCVVISKEEHKKVHTKSK